MRGQGMRAASLLVLVALLTAVLGGCGQDTVAQDGQDTVPAEEPGAVGQVIDLAGRTVEVPESVERIVAIGPGSLRLVCYAGAVDRVVGIEEFETRPPVQRPYLIANPELLELPIIGTGGPDSAPDAERLIDARPDAIFVAQVVDGQAADRLQSTTGIPVFVLTYGDLGSFDEAVFESLGLIGTVLGEQERAEEVTALIRETLADLEERSAGVAEEDKPSAYAGALGFKGLQGIESTQGEYPPFAAIGANSVTASLGQKGSVMIDKEQLLEWDPDHLFVDRSGLPLVREDVGANRALYEALTAVREGRVHAQIPFNNYWTNIETALANGYFAGTVLFPAEFSDVDPAAIYDELSTGLLGVPLYEEVASLYGGGFGTIDLLADE